MRVWRIFLGSLWLIVASVEASMQEAHQSGHHFAEGLKQQVQERSSDMNLNEVPGFQSAEPPQASLGDPAQLSEQAYQSLPSSQAGTYLMQSQASRPKIAFNPNTDPLFQVDLKAQAQALGIDPNAKAQEVVETLEKTCETGGEEVSYSCVDNRVVTPQVPLKHATLWVNHLIFDKYMESYTIPGKKGGFWKRSTPESTGTRHNGWKVQLPKDITAFRGAFCPHFQAIDAKSGEIFNIDCTRIQSFEIKDATSVSESNGELTIRVPEKLLHLTLDHDTYEGEAFDEWHSNCQAFEHMVEEGLCHYVDRVLSQGPETRTIQGYSIYKDAWQYTQHYACQFIKDDCEPLRADPSCHPMGSRCKEFKENRCWIYEQRYQCANPHRLLGAIQSPPDTAFCLTGDCHSVQYTANGEILEAIARLKMVKAMQDEIKDQDDLNLPIFKGSDRRCHRNCLNFADCCRRLKGWGVSIGFAECDENEKELAKMREHHLCHEIGTVCVDRDPVFNKCLRKETSFCCFGSRLSRVLQEQGRPQLGVGWGEAEAPNCRGLTISELSRLDLSKINFSELFSELMSKYRSPNTSALQEKANQALTQRLEHMSQPGYLRKPAQGKVDEQKEGL